MGEHAGAAVDTTLVASTLAAGATSGGGDATTAEPLRPPASGAAAAAAARQAAEAAEAERAHIERMAAEHPRLLFIATLLALNRVAELETRLNKAVAAQCRCVSAAQDGSSAAGVASAASEAAGAASQASGTSAAAAAAAGGAATAPAASAAAAELPQTGHQPGCIAELRDRTRSCFRSGLLALTGIAYQALCHSVRAQADRVRRQLQAPPTAPGQAGSAITGLMSGLGLGTIAEAAAFNIDTAIIAIGTLHIVFQLWRGAPPPPRQPAAAGSKTAAAGTGGAARSGIRKAGRR